MFSKINKVTVKTLRFYDEIGLLKPAFVDRENGYRYYTNEQLPVLGKIIALRQIGLSIDEILSILNGRNIEEILENRKKEIEASILESQNQLSQITHYLERLKEDFDMKEVIIKELPEVIVFSKRTVISNYNEYFNLIPEIAKEITAANPNLKCTEPEYCFVIYHDGEYKEKDIDIEYCEAVTTFGKDTETIKFKIIERIPTAACIYHKGSYNTLGETYAALFKWINDNGYAVTGKPTESYIDGIWNKEDEKDWLTEIQVPVLKK